MRRDNTPVADVLKSDIGSKISCQYTGMSAPRYGKVKGVSHIDGYVFIRWDGDYIDRLELMQFLRWGHVKGWRK